MNREGAVRRGALRNRRFGSGFANRSSPHDFHPVAHDVTFRSAGERFTGPESLSGISAGESSRNFRRESQPRSHGKRILGRVPSSEIFTGLILPITSPVRPTISFHSGRRWEPAPAGDWSTVGRVGSRLSVCRSFRRRAGALSAGSLGAVPKSNSRKLPNWH
jgi:hypothetical protein